MKDQMVNVFAAAYDKEEAIQIAALDALAILGREKDYLMVVDLVSNLKTDAARKAGEKAVFEIAKKVTDKTKQAAPILSALPRRRRRQGHDGSHPRPARTRRRQVAGGSAPLPGRRGGAC